MGFIASVPESNELERNVTIKVKYSDQLRYCSLQRKKLCHRCPTQSTPPCEPSLSQLASLRLGGVTEEVGIEEVHSSISGC